MSCQVARIQAQLSQTCCNGRITTATMEAKAKQMCEEAETSLKKGGFLGIFGGPSQDTLSEAGGKFHRAGVAYKTGKNWLEAARAFQRSGECYIKAKEEPDAATSYTEAARCYIKAKDTHGGIALLDNEVLPRIIDTGRLSGAAKLLHEVGETLVEEEQYAEAIDRFSKAADYYLAENSAASAMKSLTAAAPLPAKLTPPNYDESAQRYEDLGTEALKSNLLKFQAKGFFLNAILCILAAGDVVKAEMKLSQFQDADYTMAGSREGKLCEDLVATVKDMNVEAFTDAIYNYDQISKLDPWRTGVLLAVKGSISGGAAGGGAAGGAGAAGGHVDLT